MARSTEPITFRLDRRTVSDRPAAPLPRGSDIPLGRVSDRMVRG